ncbi:outer membrane protein assembly factor BamA [Candidatus Pelagibacter sp. HIMB1517]|uniref:outer membrane protein assembly factor BamA n=1 Tax=Candidatus Pelagibacter sp. HIMB1517 TaxID=3413341 RepID=UPI003F8650F9
MRKFIVFISIFFNLFFFQHARSEIFTSIEVVGNKKISNDTILNILDFNKNKNYTIQELNELQKKIFSSNFFKDVKIETKNKKLIVSVIENPIINFFYIKGIKNKSREEYIYENIELGQNKLFSNNLLKRDIDKIRQVFLDAGYFNVEINPVVSQLDSDVVNLIIEVKRKNDYKINRIFFIGDKYFSSSTLSDVILSSEHGWWKFLSQNTSANLKRVDFDKKLLKEFYLTNGFYDVQIIASDVEIISDNLLNLTFSINSGKKYLFSNFTVKDDNNLLNPQIKKNILELASKNLKKNYSTKKIKFLKNQIYDYLNLKKIEFVNFNLEEKKKDLNIEININFYSTDRKFVNLINIKGNTITEEEVVRRNLTFSSGDSFTNFKLEKSKDNLRSSGIFENINFKIINIDKELIDIEINVDEKPTGSIVAGLGVGTSGSAISGGLQEKNLFGKGINVSSNVSIGTEKVSGIVSFNLPDYNNTNNTLGYSLYARSVDYTNAGYESSLFGNSLSISYDLYEDITLKSGLAIEYDKIDTNASSSTSYKLKDGNYSSFIPFYDVNTDKRNSKFKPTNGYKLGFGQSIAIPGSDITYLKNQIYTDYYTPISKDYVFALKSGLTTINGLGSEDIKLSDRLFLSNARLRGFESQGIGPKDGKDHVGGNNSFYSSFSSTFPNPLPEKWNANSSLFVDTGNVWGVDYNDALDSNKIRSSFGVSLDWISPLGPLSFTLSETISKSSTDLEESFNFKIGSSF